MALATPNVPPPAAAARPAEPVRPQVADPSTLMPTPGYLVAHLQQQVTMLSAQLALTHDVLAQWRAYAEALEAKVTTLAPQPDPPVAAAPIEAAPAPAAPETMPPASLPLAPPPPAA